MKNIIGCTCLIFNQNGLPNVVTPNFSLEIHIEICSSSLGKTRKGNFFTIIDFGDNKRWIKVKLVHYYIDNRGGPHITSAAGGGK